MVGTSRVRKDHSCGKLVMGYPALPLAGSQLAVPRFAGHPAAAAVFGMNVLGAIAMSQPRRP